MLLMRLHKRVGDNMSCLYASVFEKEKDDDNKDIGLNKVCDVHLLDGSLKEIDNMTTKYNNEENIIEDVMIRDKIGEYLYGDYDDYDLFNDDGELDDSKCKIKILLDSKPTRENKNTLSKLFPYINPKLYEDESLGILYKDEKNKTDINELERSILDIDNSYKDVLETLKNTLDSNRYYYYLRVIYKYNLKKLDEVMSKKYSQKEQTHI